MDGHWKTCPIVSKHELTNNFIFRNLTNSLLNALLLEKRQKRIREDWFCFKSYLFLSPKNKMYLKAATLQIAIYLLYNQPFLFLLNYGIYSIWISYSDKFTCDPKFETGLVSHTLWTRHQIAESKFWGIVKMKRLSTTKPMKIGSSSSKGAAVAAVQCTESTEWSYSRWKNCLWSFGWRVFPSAFLNTNLPNMWQYSIMVHIRGGSDCGLTKYRVFEVHWNIPDFLERINNLKSGTRCWETVRFLQTCLPSFI